MGDVAWGLRPWVPDTSSQRVPAGLAVSEAASVTQAVLARAAARSLILGGPPPGGVHLATYGAAQANAQAAAEVLGLAW